MCKICFVVYPVKFLILAGSLHKGNVSLDFKNLFRKEFNISLCSAQQKIFVITCFFDIIQFDMLQCFLIAAIAVARHTNENYRTFHPSGIYLLEVNNRSTRTRCDNCSKLTIKTTERRQMMLFCCLYC